MSTWLQLDSALYRIVADVGAVAHVLTDSSRRTLSPSAKQSEYIFHAAASSYAVLARKFGRDFLRRGTGSRTYHKTPSLSFGADFLLTAYVLIVILQPGVDPEETLKGSFDSQHQRLCELIEHLPPIDGGAGKANEARLALVKK